MNKEMLAALTDEQEDQGYLKAGFLGFPKSGKTFTACLLAIAVKQHFGMAGPIAMYDTEAGSVYLRPTVKALTGENLLARRSRSFDELMRWADTCVQAGVSVALVDSITHPWRELCDSYLAQVNERRAQKRWSKQTRIEFQDWNVIKPRFAAWTDFYLNAPLHIIVCGRAGYEYDNEERDDGSGKKDLVKSGIKMKTETEFGFEPSLLVSMESEQAVAKDNARSIVRSASVLGDRFNAIDGRRAIFPSTDDPKEALHHVFEFFRPHIELLTFGAHAPIDLQSKTDFALDEQGDDNWAAEKRQRQILCEEIQGVFVSRFPGQTAAEKKAKADLLEKTFGTRSWTKVEGTPSGKLREALGRLREATGDRKPEEPSEGLRGGAEPEVEAAIAAGGEDVYSSEGGAAN
jgi:hypothetical protein